MPIQNSARDKLLLNLINGKTIVIPLDTNITIVMTLHNTKVKRKIYFKNIRDINKKYQDLVLFPVFITS